MVGVLLIAGGLLTWGHSYIHNEVHSQLAAQKIYFPAANSAAVAAPEFQAMRQYGGQELTTGAQAEVYADHFIANHLKVIGGAAPHNGHSTDKAVVPASSTTANGALQPPRSRTATEVWDPVAGQDFGEARRDVRGLGEKRIVTTR